MLQNSVILLISHIKNKRKLVKSMFLAQFNQAKLQNGSHSRISVKIRNIGIDLKKNCQNSGKASNSIIRDVIAVNLEILALEIL